jgi:D-xylose transport system ATP-binding protein
MVGRELSDFYSGAGSKPGEMIFEVRNLNAPHPEMPNRKLLDGISFSVRKGEILGIAGLMGAGRSELLMAIFGALPTTASGDIFIEGKQHRFASPNAAIKAGLALLTEDRKRFGLMPDESVLKNMTLSYLSQLSKFGVIESARERATAHKYEKLLRVKTQSIETPIKNLSGGNQQKVILAKCLMTKPKVLFLDEPTRGIDVGAKTEIYHLIRSLAAEGIAIVIVSSELPEILGLSDRVLVMCQGRITEITGKATQETIMTAALAQTGAT